MMIPVFYPLVVFSGKLYVCRVLEDSETEFDIAESSHVVYRHEHAREHPGSGEIELISYLIDIVHEGYLGEYLQMLDRELQDMSSLLRSRMDEERDKKRSRRN